MSRLPGILGRIIGRQRTAAAVQAQKPHPLDHDGDGRKGGSLPSKADLVAEAEAIGAEFEKRWNKQQISDAIMARRTQLER